MKIKNLLIVNLEELNKCGDAEYRSITQSLLDGILQHLRGA